jgi:hypothetical protein
MRDLAGGAGVATKRAVYKLLELMSLAGEQLAEMLHFCELVGEQPGMAVPRSAHAMDAE